MYLCCILLQNCLTRVNLPEIVEIYTHQTARGSKTMSISDTQVYVALVVALIPGILAFRLATQLYK